MGRAGIVLGLEVSRLARNSTDWHRLLEICALSETLILDEDGVYDPGDFNDRLLLGLKGQMSEAELHMMRARLRGGMLNAARRGELRIPLPVGLVYDPLGQVALDPDAQVQHSVRLLFDTFTRTGSASATVRHFNERRLLFPYRPFGGPHKDELHWKALTTARTRRALHNPRYAGAYAFGRNRSRRRPGGGVQTRKVPRRNGRCCCAMRIRATSPGSGSNRTSVSCATTTMPMPTARRRRPPPREGPALLQGLAVCGVCGRTMAVRYRRRKGGLQPYYLCSREGERTAGPWCQSIPGAAIDRRVGELLVELMTPLTLEVALQVQEELAARAGEADRWRAQRVQRAREEADLARQRFMQTHPDNRMVADVLEAEWNAKLRAVDEAQVALERGRAEPGQGMDEEQRRRILALASDFPRLWNDPATPHRERKRMARLLIEDVTLTKATGSLGVRLRGGATRQLSWTRDPVANKTPAEVVAEIDRLLDDHTEGEVARILNERGCRSSNGLAFTTRLVGVVCQRHDVRSRHRRLRDRGLLGPDEIGARLGVTGSTIQRWRKAGLLRAHVYCDAGYHLYEIPDVPPTKQIGVPLASRRPRTSNPATNGTAEA